jgi:hypothetical protein
MIEKKERRLLYAPILKLQKGMVLGLMKLVMNENQNSQLQVLATALRYLRFQPGKQGLNSPFTCPAGGLRGGGGSHTLPNHVTGSGRSTRHSRRVITLRPGALLEIYFLFIDSSTPIKSIHYFCDWGRRYNQVRFLAMQKC